MINPTQEKSTQPFGPDWVSPLGETILDILEERAWTQQQLANRLGYSLKHVNLLINGKVSFTEDAAIRLQTVLGASVGFWFNGEALYRERAALLDMSIRNSAMVPWLEGFPIKDLMRLGGLTKQPISAPTKPALAGELLAFFGVASQEQWQSQYGAMQVAFRRSRQDQADVEAISAWLRLGERAAEKLEGTKFDRRGCSGRLLSDSLKPSKPKSSSELFFFDLRLTQREKQKTIGRAL